VLLLSIASGSAALGQTCPAFPSPGAGITILSPEPDQPFLSGDEIEVAIQDPDPGIFIFNEAVARWAYGTDWAYSTPYTMTLPIPESAPGPGLQQQTFTIRVAGVDSTGDAREATVQVLVQRDTDEDGVPDASDNCPYLANPDTQGQGNGQYHVNDKNGDNVGNVCQCADVNGSGYVGDGYITVSDQTAIYNLIFQTPNPYNNRADTNNSGSTTVTDYSNMTTILFGGQEGCTPTCLAYPVVPANNPYLPDNACP
jgi:hypothetical protein